MAVGAGTADNATFAQLMAAQAARANPANYAPGSREYNLAQAWQTTGQNIQNQYNSPVGQAVLAAAGRLGPNAGEKAINQWLSGGPIDFGLAANSIDAQFRLGQLGGALINDYMAGGGTRAVPVDYGGGMFGWTRDANGNYIAPQGDQSGITWNPTTHRFEGDLLKATQYYMQGMHAGNQGQGPQATMTTYTNPQGQTWVGANNGGWMSGNPTLYANGQVSGGTPANPAVNTAGGGTTTNDSFNSLYNYGQNGAVSTDQYMPMGGYGSYGGYSGYGNYAASAGGPNSNSNISDVLSQLLNRQ